jgi:hypothetical protein
LSAEDKQELAEIAKAAAREAVVEAARDGLLGPEAQQAANGSLHHPIAPP